MPSDYVFVVVAGHRFRCWVRDGPSFRDREVNDRLPAGTTQFHFCLTNLFLVAGDVPHGL